MIEQSMCGIAGIYGRVDPTLVERMMLAQAHRGPDDHGLWSDETQGITLGHRRLSIIDLSPAGKQPMSYADDRLWIIFNGEIYNYRELRRALEDHGCAFRSETDTEVLLAAYQVWGTACLPRLRGMFAFALFDRRPPDGAPRLLLARDRLGIKPLLYYEAPGGSLIFASELRALLQCPDLRQRVDGEALLDYLAYGMVFQPRTMLTGVRALLPGHYLHDSAAGWQLACYWDLHRETMGLRQELAQVAYGEAVTRLDTALKQATRYHLVADVPVGAFLSGGVDSTAVVSLMTRQTGTAVKTFTVGFEREHRDLDERHHAREAARELACDHHELVLTKAQGAALFDTLVAAIDQPSVDGANTYLVSRAASQVVKVALSGIGGDELFAGYPHFRSLSQALDRGLDPLTLLPHVRRLLDDRRLPWAARGGLGADEASSRLLQRYEALLPHQNTGANDPGDAVQQVSYAETKGYLLSMLLRDSDIMSMAHSLELRPVLLDHPLVELAYAMPADYKLRGGQTKRVFVDAASTYLPQGVRGRTKMGYWLPLTAWINGPLRQRFRQLLQTQNAGRLFRRRYRLELELRLRLRRAPFALWAWGVLLAWLDAHHLDLDL
jgi:asparagine synthase (glutamine-hydrolysing)